VRRYFAAMGAVIVVMLAAVGLGACGGETAQATADHPNVANRAKLVTVGGARLDPKREQQVTVLVSKGQVRITAEVSGAAPTLNCTLRRLEGVGDAVDGTAVALSTHSRLPTSDGIIFTLSSSQVDAGMYRLTYTGHGWLKYLGIGANYR
jgi:hypothetical protein